MLLTSGGQPGDGVTSGGGHWSTYGMQVAGTHPTRMLLVFAPWICFPSEVIFIEISHAKNHLIKVLDKKNPVARIWLF